MQTAANMKRVSLGNQAISECQNKHVQAFLKN